MSRGPQPTLTTARLVLRPLVASDAPEVQRLAGAREIAAGIDASWAIVHDGRLVGCVALHFVAPDHGRVGLGYWVGHADWGRGTLRRFYRGRDGGFVDVEQYAMLRDDR